jgi:hypothetical protein
MPKCGKSCKCARHHSPPNFVDLIGKRFGRLTVTKRLKVKWVTVWLCRCSCGEITKVFGSNLRSGHTQSCGCLTKEITAQRNRANIRHGHCVAYKSTRIYRIWSSMLERCRTPQHRAYKHYGGRGIRVCEQWLIFENFLADMGERPPGRSLDRIDNDGNYEPSNCRWATQTEQVRNRRASAPGARRRQTSSPRV